MSLPVAAYKPRRLQDSAYYHCVEDYFETLVQSCDEHFSKQYGFWRPYIEKIICRNISVIGFRWQEEKVVFSGSEKIKFN